MRTNHLTPDHEDVFEGVDGVRDARTLVNALSPRCREVLHGLVAGQSNKIIAYKLGISPRTVEAHRANMMRHLGARHLAGAIRVALDAERFDCAATAQEAAPKRHAAMKLDLMICGS